MMELGAAAVHNLEAGASPQRDLEKADPSGGRKPRAGYRPDIDGLRAMAVTSVVFFHAGLWPFSSGFVGVDIFFVISGYLIGGIILRDLSGETFSFATFYARRARRILPALSFVVLATCLASWFLLDGNEYKDVGAIGTLALVGASNINFWQFQDYFADDSRLRILLMTWSLGVEEQFYLVFPLFLMAVQKFAPRRLLIVLGAGILSSFLASLTWTWSAPVAAFYLLPARAWELGVGVMLAALGLARDDGRRPASGRSTLAQELLASVGLAALVLAIVSFDEHTPFPGFVVLLPVLGAAALLSSSRSWINRKFLSSRPAVFVGLVSYSWYLWHWPMMSMLRNVVPTVPRTSVLVGVAAASFLLAVATWWFVERPFRRVSLSVRQVLTRYALALVVIGVAPTTIRMTAGVPWRLSATTRHLEQMSFGTVISHSECITTVGSSLSGNVLCSDRPSGRAVAAILGDSHAWAAFPGVRRIAQQQNIGYEVFARALCPPVLGVSVRSSKYPNLAIDCERFKASALSRIIEDPQATTVILASFWSGTLDGGYFTEGSTASPSSTSDLLRFGLGRMVSRLRAAGKRVIIVQDVPKWDFDPLEIALDNSMPARGWLANLFDSDVHAILSGSVPIERASAHEDVRHVVASFATADGWVRVIDPFSRFCDARRCIFEKDGEPFFFDDNHLTPSGAEMVLRGIRLQEK